MLAVLGMWPRRHPSLLHCPVYLILASFDLQRLQSTKKSFQIAQERFMRFAQNSLADIAEGQVGIPPAATQPSPMAL
jgi:hypothetical protein